MINHLYTRQNPYLSRIKERELLSGRHSTKRTYHVVLEIDERLLNYKVGDSIGVCPANDPEEVDLILEAVGAAQGEMVLDPRTKENISIREFLIYRANLARVNRPFLELCLEKGFYRNVLEPLLQEKENLSQFLQTHTMHEVLCKAPLSAAEIAKTAMPLLPRFYSIANSVKVFPDEVHLLVAYVQYHCNGQTRRGVGSHFLCDLAEIGSTSIPIYVQPSNHFTLPEDPSSSIILIGPGTGIAPFRAFLQERMASQSTGRNWLFFGERNRASDFYYEPYWLDLEKENRLRLDLAFSRDGKEKTYVQHKLYERRKSLWQWISEGAYIYVCGNAEKMAKDVDAMLQKIIKEGGNFSEEDALQYLKGLRRSKRYLMDVY